MGVVLSTRSHTFIVRWKCLETFLKDSRTSSVGTAVCEQSNREFRRALPTETGVACFVIILNNNNYVRINCMVRHSLYVTASPFECVADRPHHESVTITIIISSLSTLSTGSFRYSHRPPVSGQWSWLDRIIDGSFLHLSSHDFVCGIFRGLSKEIYAVCALHRTHSNKYVWISFACPSCQVTWLRIYALVSPSKQLITAHGARKKVDSW